MTYVEQLERDVQLWRLRAEKPATRYGNCKRGCAPAYLDDEDFCSPQCKLGQPRRLGEGLLLASAM